MLFFYFFPLPRGYYRHLTNPFYKWRGSGWRDVGDHISPARNKICSTLYMLVQVARRQVWNVCWWLCSLRDHDFRLRGKLCKCIAISSKNCWINFRIPCYGIESNVYWRPTFAPFICDHVYVLANVIPFCSLQHFTISYYLRSRLQCQKEYD